MTDHTPPTTEHLAEIEARATAATEGPWCTDAWEIYQGTQYVPGISMWIGETCRGTSTPEQDQADAAFVAAARTDVPALIAEVARLKGQRKYLLTELAKRDAESGRGNEALREFFGEQPAEETHVVADDSDDPEHVDDCPGCAAAAAGESGSTR